MAAAASRYSQYIKPITQSALFKNEAIRSYSPYFFSIITAALLIMFAIRPTVSTILNLQKDIQNHQETLSKLKEKSKNITQAKQNLEKIDGGTKAKITNSVPPNASVATIVTSLKGSVPKDASAASVIQIQPVPLTGATTSPSPQLELVRFTFNMEGGFEIFLSTLNNIKVAPRSISVDSVTISKQTEGATIMSLNGKAYYLK